MFSKQEIRKNFLNDKAGEPRLPFLFSFFDFFLSPAAHPQVLTHLVLQLLRLDRLCYIIAEA